jgi:hypothetical protein
MGCFSSVCAVSKLPIFGHPVVGIPVIKAPVSCTRTACYPGTDWKICGFPFFGDNDEYGGIKNYQEGFYHKLNVKMFGKQIESDENFLRKWDTVRDENIMFIHRSVWDKLMDEFKDRATFFYRKNLKDSNRFAVAMNNTHNIKENYIRKVPEFNHEDSGFSRNFIKWCEENYSFKVKKAVVDLLAFDISCTYTHTVYHPAHSVGVQMSDWKFETEWCDFLCKFAKEEFKKESKNNSGVLSSGAVCCISCGSTSNLEYGPNPYNQDVKGDNTNVWLCNDCCYESSSDI